MIKIPQNIAILFDQQPAARSIPEQSRSHFCKWLRFYLDFCHKYGFTSSEKSSPAAFIDKKQNVYNQQQAAQAVSIYYDLLSAGNQRPQGTTSEKNGNEKPFTPYCFLFTLDIFIAKDYG